jgi:hypothetical protein
LSVAERKVRAMKGKALFAAARDARGLRELPGGPLRVAQPSRVDDIREARFDAYRARAGEPAEWPAEQAATPADGQPTRPTDGQATEPTDGQATEPTDEQATARAEAARAAVPTGRDPEAWRALNDAAAAYRERLAAARSEVAKPAADRADVAQRGMAAVREALRHRP